jgi:nucleotide-binding universal stress UspA family protein
MNETPPENAVRSRLAIVVGLAFTDADGPAFDQAARIAQRVPSSELHLVHVFHEPLSEERSRDLASHLRLYVNEKAAVMGGLKGITVGIHLRVGAAVHEIVELAREIAADLIVVGSRRGPHIAQWIVGSTAQHLVGGAPCPVLVASPAPQGVESHRLVIEPPCPDCVRTRAASAGARWWCDRHSHRIAGGHVYSYQRELPLTMHDSQIIPTGIDF